LLDRFNHKFTSIDLRTAKVKKTATIYVLLFLIGIGSFLRLINIENKVYWTDEVFTSLQVSGHQVAEVRESIFTGYPVGNETLETFQYPVSKDKGYLDTVKGLISFEPQHTPGYFLAARAWLKAVGNSIGKIRFLSVIFSFISIGSIYLLCKKMFGKEVFGLAGAAILSVSPFHLLYAQEARPYGMWIALTLISCLAFQEAKEKGKLVAWAIYSSSLLLSLYTFLFAILTIFSHGAYVLITKGKYNTGNQSHYWKAALVAVTLFSPWMWILFTNPTSNYATEARAGLAEYFKAWIRNNSLIFVDFNLNDSSWLPAFVLFSIYAFALVIFSALIIYFCWKHMDRDNFLFLICLLFIPFLIPLLYDLVKGGILSTKAGYIIPSLVSLQIMFAYMLGELLCRSKEFNHYLVKASFAVLLIGVLSCGYMSMADSWWLKGAENDKSTIDAARIINESTSPLVVSDSFFIPIFMLSHYLEEAQYLLVPETKYETEWFVPTIPAGFQVFLFRPSEPLLEALSQKMVITQKVDGGVLWQVENQ
jgi:uncharacterized membrane protein